MVERPARWTAHPVSQATLSTAARSRRSAPSLGSAQATGLVGLALLVGLLCMAGSLLNDPDTQWHVATGRLIWETGRVPLTDPFSHTFGGSPWIAKEWLSQLILFAAFAGGDWWGVGVLTALVIAATFAGLYAFLLARVHPTAALAMVLLALTLALPECVARPHILVLPLVAGWTMGLTAALDRGAAPPLWLAGLMPLWANMHASYPLAFVLAAALGGEAIRQAAPDRQGPLLRRWGLFLGVTAVAACVSPYGPRTILVVANLLETPEATRYIREWQPLGLGLQGVTMAAAVILAGWALLPRWRNTLFRIGMVLLLGYATVRHVRFALIFAVVVPVLIAGPLSSTFGRLRAAAAPDEGARRRPLLVAAALVAALLAAATRPQPDPSVAPADALAFAARRGLSGPVYNDYDFGGYLVRMGVRTFIDGRSDQLFSGGFTTRLNEALEAPSNELFAAILARQHVTWALVRPGSSEDRHLSTMPGWVSVYGDPYATVYAVRPGAPLK